MKKIIITLIILVGGILLFIVLHNDRKLDLKEIINDLIKNEEILKESDNYYNPQEYSLINDETNGIISISIYDFDNDKDEEVIIARKKTTDIELTLYELEDKKLTEKDKIIVLEEVFNYADIIDANSFIKIIDNSPYLFYEASLYSSLVADGITWKFAKIGVNEGRFIDIAKDEFSGSYFDDEYINAKKDFVKEASLNISDFWFYENGISLYEQNKDNAYLMYEIERNHLDSFQIDNYYSSSETKVLYGKTTFKDLSKDYMIGA